MAIKKLDDGRYEVDIRPTGRNGKRIRRKFDKKSEAVAFEKYTLYNHHNGFAPIFPDTCYHLTHYWLAAADIPVASDNPVHYADAIRYNARTPLQGSLLPLTRLVWA